MAIKFQADGYYFVDGRKLALSPYKITCHRFCDLFDVRVLHDIVIQVWKSIPVYSLKKHICTLFVRNVLILNAVQLLYGLRSSDNILGKSKGDMSHQSIVLQGLLYLLFSVFLIYSLKRYFVCWP